MDKVLLRESDIKAALIDRIEGKGLLQDAALINEMVVANWSRRVDLAVANGNLHAYEIKSDLDSLKRLDGQLDSYLARFDKVTVVCATKFTAEVLKRTPPSVEVLEVFYHGEQVEFRVARRGQLKPVKDKGILLSFLLKAELVDLLKQNFIAIDASSTRRALEIAADSLPLNTIRGYVLECLKSRYWATSEAFIQSRRQRDVVRTRVEDLSKLSKVKLQHHLQQSKSVSGGADRSATAYREESAVNIDWDRIMAAHERTPSDMPGYVLKRRVSQ